MAQEVQKKKKKTQGTSLANILKSLYLDGYFILK